MKRHITKNRYVLFILVFFISLGFAYLSANLNILGGALLKSSSWDIHFEEIEVIEEKAIIECKVTLDAGEGLFSDEDFALTIKDDLDDGSEATLEGIKSKLSIYVNYEDLYGRFHRYYIIGPDPDDLFSPGVSAQPQ